MKLFSKTSEFGCNHQKQANSLAIKKPSPYHHDIDRANHKNYNVIEKYTSILIPRDFDIYKFFVIIN